MAIVINKVSQSFILFVILFVFPAICKTIVPKPLVQDFTDREFAKVVAITGKLMAYGSHKELQEFLLQLKQVVYRRRLAKCEKLLGSKQLCESNVRFYIWAQKVAKKIMAGESI